ncbi:MAG: DUF2283 domain-containing protein [Dehalococcoidia bacterium]
MGIKHIKDIDVVNIELQQGEFEYGEEIGEGVILDVGQDGDILSIEIVDATISGRYSRHDGSGI